MMVVAHGVDIIECERIARVYREHGDRFLERIYTPAERDYCLAGQLSITRLAGRFAAKEAVFKVLGTGWRGDLRWTDVETLPDAFGKPQVTLVQAAAELAQRVGVAEVLISISHTREHAVASAIGVGPGRVVR